MNATHERRTEERLRYHWPIWYAEDFNGELSQGQMADISSRAAAFTCYADEQCPHPVAADDFAPSSDRVDANEGPRVPIEYQQVAGLHVGPDSI